MRELFAFAPVFDKLFSCLDSVVYDETLFPNSHDFQPERFIDTDGKVYNQDKVLTFSLGKFICINMWLFGNIFSSSATESRHGNITLPFGIV
jgi:hypothetical protein